MFAIHRLSGSILNDKALWRGTEHIEPTLLHYLDAFLTIVCMVIGFGDIVYSFYIASQVYGQFDEFQQGHRQLLQFCVLLFICVSIDCFQLCFYWP